MFFWFKKPKVILECFTTEELVYEYAKIDKAVKFFPDWWKKTKKIENNYYTIKNCTGILDFYQKGITMPLWANLNISLNGDGTFEWRSSNHVMKFESHDRLQFSRFSENVGYNIKIMTPWAFRTKNVKYFIMSDPIYNHRNLINYMTIMPGVLEFKYNLDMNVNFFLTESQKTHIEIDAFTPLLILHPLFEESVEIKNFLVSEKEMSKIYYSNRFIDFSNLQKRHASKKKIVDYVENKSKCPFGFK